MAWGRTHFTVKRCSERDVFLWTSPYPLPIKEPLKMMMCFFPGGYKTSLSCISFRIRSARFPILVNCLFVKWCQIPLITSLRKNDTRLCRNNMVETKKNSFGWMVQIITSRVEMAMVGVTVGQNLTWPEWSCVQRFTIVGGCATQWKDMLVYISLKSFFIHPGWSRILPLKRITARKVCWWFQLIWEISTNQAISPKREVNISKTYWKQASKKHHEVIGWLIQLKFTSEFGNLCGKECIKKLMSKGPIYVSVSALMEVMRSETKQKRWTFLLLLVTFSVLLKSCFLWLQNRINFQPSTGVFRWWVFVEGVFVYPDPLTSEKYDERSPIIWPSICFKRVSSQNHQLGSTRETLMACLFQNLPRESQVRTRSGLNLWTLQWWANLNFPGQQKVSSDRFISVSVLCT